MSEILGLFEPVLAFGQNGNWKMIIMWAIGAVLIYLAIKKNMEPTLLLPIGFGAILMNFPNTGIAEPLETLYNAGIANELFPLILFIGIGAIAVAAYSYMALVPIIQPPVIKLLTTKKERLIRMKYEQKSVSKTTKILFPIIISVVACIFVPSAASLIGFLMFGNLIRECGVLNSISDTAQNVLANLITIFLGITIAFQMSADKFLNLDTLLILGLGLVAFIVDTAGGVLFAKLYNIILKIFGKDPINPMIGAAGISAFPMSGRIVHKMGLAEDHQNFLLMHAIGVNVSGQIASVIAGSLVLGFFLK